MKAVPSPIVARYQLGADGSTYRGLPKEVLATGFHGWVKSKVLPELAATGIRRVLWWMPGGFAMEDEPDKNMSFRTWTILKQSHFNAAATMSAALDLLEPHIDELIVYLGNLASSLPRLTSTNPRAFLTNLGDCLGVFAAHKKVSFAFDASALFKPDGIAEMVFQMLRAWTDTHGRRVRLYREGAPHQQCPGQWRDPGIVSDSDCVTAHATKTDWYPDEANIEDELIVQQPDGDWGGDKSAKLIPWIDRRVHAGYSVAVAPEHLITQKQGAGRWNRTVTT